MNVLHKYRMLHMSLMWAHQLYHLESLHLEVCPLSAAVLTDMTKETPVASFALCTYLAFPKQGVVKNCWYVVCHYFCHHCQILGLQKVYYFPHHLPTWSSYNPGPGAFHTCRTDDLNYSYREVFTPFCIPYLPEYTGLLISP